MERIDTSRIDPLSAKGFGELRNNEQKRIAAALRGHEAVLSYNPEKFRLKKVIHLLHRLGLTIHNPRPSEEGTRISADLVQYNPRDRQHRLSLPLRQVKRILKSLPALDQEERVLVG